MIIKKELQNHKTYFMIQDIFDIYKHSSNSEKENFIKYFNDKYANYDAVVNSISLLYQIDFIKYEENIIYNNFIFENYKEFREAFIKALLKSIWDNEEGFLDVQKFIPYEENFLIEKAYFPQRYFALRNLFLKEEILRAYSDYHFCLNQNLISFVKKERIEKRRVMSLEDLKNTLSNQAMIGQKAEETVLEYEKKRLKVKMPDIISNLDVAAGYDIISYNNDESILPDRYIEVKYVGDNNVFYWSKNEIEVSQNLKENYFYIWL